MNRLAALAITFVALAAILLPANFIASYILSKIDPARRSGRAGYVLMVRALSIATVVIGLAVLWAIDHRHW